MSFTQRFWSPNYSGGLETLFSKLDQGVVENGELLALAATRADAEEAHGQRLRAIAAAQSPRKDGFARDDGATMRRAYEAVIAQMEDEGRQHEHMALAVREMVVAPFTKWSRQHQTRVKASQDKLRRLLKAYEGELGNVHKAQQRYFNRCRLDEEPDGDGTKSEASSGTAESAADGSGNAEYLEGSSEELNLGSRHYSAEQSQQLLARALREIEQGQTKVSFFGTYNNVVTGSQLCEWLQATLALPTLAEAESIGQSLVNYGFLRLIGQVGSRFVNSTVFKYQWRPKAWEFAGLSRHSIDAAPTASELYNDIASRFREPSVVSVKELDQRYKKAVAILDRTRVELELAMFETLAYLETCERERLAAFKAVLLDFAASLSNIVPALSAGVDKLLLFQETADVERDLKYLTLNYQSGDYHPQTVVYDNYYSSADGAAVFGLDLELRARADRKRVPILVAAVLSQLDSAYPQMSSDAERVAIWQQPMSAHLKATQAAREEINAASMHNQNVRDTITAQLADLQPPVLVQLLKLYLLELPVSLIAGQYYDLLRGVYQKFGEDEPARVQALQNVLMQLPLSHVATLDAITAQLKRVVTISNASAEDIDAICAHWGRVVCRPKTASALTLDDQVPARALHDILCHRDAIFSELKRSAATATSVRRLRSQGKSTREGTPETDQTWRRSSLGSSSHSSQSSHGRPELASSDADVGLRVERTRARGEARSGASEKARQEAREEVREEAHDAQVIPRVTSQDDAQRDANGEASDVTRDARGVVADAPHLDATNLTSTALHPADSLVGPQAQPVRRVSPLRDASSLTSSRVSSLEPNVLSVFSHYDERSDAEEGHPAHDGQFQEAREP